MPTGETLKARLEIILSKLQAGDVLSAEALLVDIEKHLTASIEPELLNKLRATHHECMLAAAKLQSSLSEQLRQSGTFRRATSAYSQP